MPLEVLQRFTWNGTLREIGDLFRVTKNRRNARAVIFSHQCCWEVRLLVGCARITCSQRRTGRSDGSCA